MVTSKLVDLYDIISKDIIIMDNNIKQAKKDCNYEDVLTYCAGKIYAHKVIQEINKLMGDDIINKLIEHINEELQFLENKIQWLQECDEQLGAAYLEGSESAYREMFNIINGEYNE